MVAQHADVLLKIKEAKKTHPRVFYITSTNSSKEGISHPLFSAYTFPFRFFDATRGITSRDFWKSKWIVRCIGSCGMRCLQIENSKTTKKRRREKLNHRTCSRDGNFFLPAFRQRVSRTMSLESMHLKKSLPPLQQHQRLRWKKREEGESFFFNASNSRSSRCQFSARDFIFPVTTSVMGLLPRRRTSGTSVRVMAT